MTVRRLLLLLAALLAVAAGCGDDDSDSGGGDGGGATTTTEDAATSTAAAADAAVEVVDPGSEPRRELRYRFQAGTEVTQRVEADVEQTINGTPSPATTIVMDIITRVRDVTDGEALVALEYGSITVEPPAGSDPGSVESLQAALATLTGTSVELRLDELGRAVGPARADVGDVDPQLQLFAQQLVDSLEQLAVGLPEEAVGEGAVWRTVTEVGSSGVTVETTAEVRLESLGDDAIEVATTANGETSGAATGTTTGSGTFRIDLTSPLAEGELTVETTVESGGAEFVQRLVQRVSRL